MSDLTPKSRSQQTRKPLNNLTESQANRLMHTTPLNHTQYPHVLPAAMEESGQIQLEHQLVYSPPRMFAGGANRSRLYTEFNGSSHPCPPLTLVTAQVSYPQSEYHDYGHDGLAATGHSRFVPETNPQVSYRQSEYHDRKRFKVDHGHVTAEDREPSHEDPRATAQDDSRLLWLPEDQQHLTELHCFVRKHCVFIFSATSENVGTKRKGRKKALTLGQIGIGCLHCKRSESKLKGSTYFPTSINGIYNATMIIQQRHFPICPSVSMEAFCEYNKLKGLTARSASTKEYWISAAKKLGLVDTSKGVFFREQPNVTRAIGKPQAARHSESLVRLVEPSDKMFATEYAYFVMEQMTTCVFTESDRLGKRKCHKVGFPGLACRHCYGGNGSGRFFPLTLKTFSDVSKSIHVLRNHLVKCTKAPSGTASTVKMLYGRHKEEKQITPFGSQKIFFDQIWRRLHPELTTGIKKPTEAKPPPAISQNMTRHCAAQTHETNNMFKPEARTPLPPLPSPPIIHRGNMGSSQNIHQDEIGLNKERCMIPKKRYLYSHSISHHQPDLPPRYPRPPSNQTPPHTESDVSVAMILANGFGKNKEEESFTKPGHEEV